jgi:hypothetical protein
MGLDPSENAKVAREEGVKVDGQVGAGLVVALPRIRRMLKWPWKKRWLLLVPMSRLSVL